MGKNPMGFIIALLVSWLLTTFLVSQFLGVGFSLVAGLIFAAGLVYIGKWVGLVKSDIFGLNQQFSAILGIGLVVVALFMVGINVVGILGSAATSATVANVVSPTAQVSVTGDSCWNSVTAETRGLAATFDLNAYDYANDTQASAVDTAWTLYEAARVAAGDNVNKVSSITDTTAATANVVIGKTYSFGPNSNTLYYGEPQEGVCMRSARQSVNLEVYNITIDGSLQTTVYDSTGATALGAASVVSTDADYTLTLGASEETSIEAKTKVNVANRAYWLSAYGTISGVNVTEVSPTGNSAGLFTKVATPLYLDSQTWSTAYATGISLTRSFNVYKLNAPKLMFEFESQQYRFKVKASSYDPAISNNTAGGAMIAVQALDGAWIKGNDGKTYFDIYDHTPSEGNVGMTESTTSPQGKTSGAVIELA